MQKSETLIVLTTLIVVPAVTGLFELAKDPTVRATVSDKEFIDAWRDVWPPAKKALVVTAAVFKRSRPAGGPSAV